VGRLRRERYVGSDNAFSNCMFVRDGGPDVVLLSGRMDCHG
jgi:hypothetical protein